MADPALLPRAHEVPAPHHVAVAALEAGGDRGGQYRDPQQRLLDPGHPLP